MSQKQMHGEEQLLQVEASETGISASPFRLDTQMHEQLMQPAARSALEPAAEPQLLPEPVFPQHAGNGKKRSRLSYHLASGWRGMRNWVIPYLKGRISGEDFKPMLSYLFTEYKCNLTCHYCWAYYNKVKGMREEVARRSIDWLHSIDCRVLALMGGEPLLRPKFVHKVVYYAAKKGFFVYVPTNGRLMSPKVIDWLGDAGVATMNLAIDCVEEKPGLPKALEHIRTQFDYLVKMQHQYGYMIILNINICRNNMDDVKELTEIAYQNGISTDYHINEPPLMEHEHFQHLEDNLTYLRPEDFPRVDELLDYLIEKNRKGYIMVNSRAHLEDMRDFMRGKVKPWQCRAGQNTMIIRTDGTLAPCFAMYSAKHDWGVVEKHNFEVEQLDEMKKSCNTSCLSTCNYIVGHYYNDTRAIWMAIKQLLHGHQGMRGNLSQN